MSECCFYTTTTTIAVETFATHRRKRPTPYKVRFNYVRLFFRPSAHRCKIRGEHFSGRKNEVQFLKCAKKILEIHASMLALKSNCLIGLLAHFSID